MQINFQNRNIILFPLLMLFLALTVVLFYSCFLHRSSWIDNNSEYNKSCSYFELHDRDGQVLLTGEGEYAADYATKLSTLHVVGDRAGNIGASVLSVLRLNAASKRQSDYDFINGLYDKEQNRQEVIELTISSRLSAAALEAMGDYNGVVLLGNYRTGEILIMLSTPTYDPDGDLENVDTDARYGGAYYNKTLQSSFVPGSIFKLVTLSALLESNSVSYRQFTCTGSREVIDGESYCQVTCGKAHGQESLSAALTNSCNCAFAAIAIKMGEELTDFVTESGVCDSVSLADFELESLKGQWQIGSDVELAWAGAGQSTVLVNPLAFLGFVNAIANDGVQKQFYLSLGKEGSETRIMSEATAQTISKLMYNCVAESYSSINDFAGYQVCAKSGTAETGNGTSHSWFTGFIDDEDNPYSFLVLCENGGSGAVVAGAVAAAVIKELTACNL